MCITANLVSKQYQSFGYYDSLWYCSMIGMYLTISLCFSASSQVYDMVPLSLYTIEGVNCVSQQFGSFMSIYTSVGKVVSLHNLGGYLSITAIWRYRCIMVLMVHTMFGIYILALSLCKSGVGTLSLYTIRGVNCVSLQFGSFMFIYDMIHLFFKVPKKLVPADLLFSGMC